MRTARPQPVGDVTAYSRAEQLIARGRNEPVCTSYALRPDRNMMTQRDTLRYALHRPLRRALAWVFAIFSPLALRSCETQNLPTKHGQLTGRVGPGCEPQQKTNDRSSGEPFPRFTGIVAPPEDLSRYLV